MVAQTILKIGMLKSNVEEKLTDFMTAHNMMKRLSAVPNLNIV